MEIARFLAEHLDLELHVSKRKLRSVSSGIDFLGYIVRPFYILVRRRVVGNLKYRMQTGRLDRQAWASYMGHFKYANARRLERSLQGMLMGTEMEQCVGLGGI